MFKISREWNRNNTAKKQPKASGIMCSRAMDWKSKQAQGLKTFYCLMAAMHRNIKPELNA